MAVDRPVDCRTLRDQRAAPDQMTSSVLIRVGGQTTPQRTAWPADVDMRLVASPELESEHVVGRTIIYQLADRVVPTPHTISAQTIGESVRPHFFARRSNLSAPVLHFPTPAVLA